MFCTKCGTQVDDGSAFCTNCGMPLGGNQNIPKDAIKSHLVGAILQLIVCIPAGIVPLIYACKVNSKLIQGDIAGAQEASKKAKFWINLGTAIVGTLIIISIIVNAISKVNAISNGG